MTLRQGGEKTEFLKHDFYHQTGEDSGKPVYHRKKATRTWGKKTKVDDKAREVRPAGVFYAITERKIFS